MEKIKKLVRLTPEIAEQLREIAGLLNISENEAVSRAITHYYMSLKQEREASISGNLIPLSKYEELQDQVRKLVYKVGELQGRLEEKDNLVKSKDELISELRRQIEELKAKPQKKWWRFW